MGAKGGYKPKDAPISENFNQDKQGGLSEKDLRALERRVKLETLRLEREAATEERRLLAEAGKEKPAEEPGPEGEPGDSNDAKSAYEMLQDMRWVYRQLKGRDKLKKLVNSDDRQFVFMVKELMKIETALLSAKIRAREDPGGKGDRMVFVVLKGLKEEDTIRQMISAGQDAVDVKQITQAVKPDGSEYSETEGV